MAEAMLVNRRKREIAMTIFKVLIKKVTDIGDVPELHAKALSLEEKITKRYGGLVNCVPPGKSSIARLVKRELQEDAKPKTVSPREVPRTLVPLGVARKIIPPRNPPISSEPEVCVTESKSLDQVLTERLDAAVRNGEVIEIDMDDSNHKRARF